MTPAATTPVALTRPEVQVLTLLARGRSYAEIAEELSLSVDAIKSRLKRMYAKLEAANGAHAVSIGIGMRLVLPENPIAGGEA